MLDSDLARLYGVTTKRLNEQVKRNLKRFPVDFMFQITEAEYQILRSQIATSRKSSFSPTAKIFDLFLTKWSQFATSKKTAASTKIAATHS
jgi:hypothetical protein